MLFDSNEKKMNFNENILCEIKEIKRSDKFCRIQIFTLIIFIFLKITSIMENLNT